MAHITRRLRAYAESNQFVFRPKRAIEQETIGGLHDSFDFWIARAYAGGIAEAWPSRRLAHEQRDIVSRLWPTLVFQIERDFSRNGNRGHDQLGRSAVRRQQRLACIQF